MFAIDPKSFYDAIKPLVYFNCFAGVGVMRLPNQNDALYFVMKLYTVIVIFLQWIVIYVTLSSIALVISFEDASTMTVMMYRILVCTNSGITITTPFLAWLRKKVMRECLQQMTVLDHAFETIHGARNEYRKDYIRLTYQVVAIFLFMCSVALFDTIISLQVEVRMTLRALFMLFSVAYTMHQPILVMLLLDVNFCTFVVYLGKKFQDLNKSLLGLTEKPTSSYPRERLFIVSQKVKQTKHRKKVNDVETDNLVRDKHHLFQEIRKGHLELCKLSQKINVAFGIQNLLSIGISFCMITGLLYTIYSAFSRKDFTSNTLREVISSGIWTAIYMFKIWLINHCCWSTSNEASKTGEVIYELLNSKVDKELEREVREFGLQMIQNTVQFNACGFFTLDYTFVQGVIGTITTYLVILIQMGQVSENP